MQVAPTSSKQHGVNVGVNASATPFQQASGYGSHGYSTGEAIHSVEMACSEGPCRSCSIYLHTNILSAVCSASVWALQHLQASTWCLCYGICYARVRTVVNGSWNIIVFWFSPELLNILDDINFLWSVFFVFFVSCTLYITWGLNNSAVFTVENIWLLLKGFY